MRHLSDWSNLDGSLLLHFDPAVMQIFAAHVQLRGRPESGGILLGTVHDNGLLVRIATQPSRHDKQSAYLFERMAFGHRAAARRHWRSSGGIVRYLGDWHTHPQDFPTPSGLDLEEWQKLARARKDERPTLSVIVGRKALHVEMMDKRGKRSPLSATHENL